MDAHLKQTISQLGPRLAIYKPRTGKIILLGIFLIIVGLPCAIGGMLNNTSPTVYTNSSNSLALWFLGAGIGLALIGFIALILAFSNRKMRVDVHEQGFVATNKDGTKEIRWDQIVHVWHKLEETIATTAKDPKTGVSTSKIRKISTDVNVVNCADGTTCEINTSFYGLSAFAPILEQTYTRYLLPRALASYQAGTPLAFGTLTVSSSGISNMRSDGNTELAWGSFNAIEVDKNKGSITIRRGPESQPWSSISLTDTPDVALFEALVNTIASKQ